MSQRPDLQDKLKRALHGGDPDAVRKLLDAGADLQHRNDDGYDALINAVHGREILRDPHLLDLLTFLVERGVPLSGITTYNESGLSVLSRIGRFDAVEFLLHAGADERLLAWTPLHRAVASGICDDIRALLDTGASIEALDGWHRTPWLLAILTGDIAKADLLRSAGANLAAVGRCNQPPLFYAIRGRQPAMLRWLLDLGISPKQTDQFGSTTLIEAVEADDLEIVDVLIGAGVDLDVDQAGTDLSRIESAPVAKRLLAAGANPATLKHEGQRILLGLGKISKKPLREITGSQFRQTPARTFGDANPQRMNHEFWLAMIRSGVSASEATRHFADKHHPSRAAVWCAQRHGQTLTFLSDGRAVQIAGEHEDGYDPDFCIYNDVFLHHPDGSIDILGYPEAIFPPTDFHTATFLGDTIYLIGSLGYKATRGGPTTPVYQLNTATWRISAVSTTGDSPGWLHGHRAELLNDGDIRISGGKVITRDASGKEQTTPNHTTYLFNALRREWRHRKM